METDAYKFLADYFPDVLKFGVRVILAILVFWLGSRAIECLVKAVKKSLSVSRMDTGVIQFLASLSRIVLYVLLIFNIAAGFGVKESSLAAILGTAGVTLGLALQGGLSNLAGGMMLLLFKPFQVGDYILLNGQTDCEGTVVKIDISYTTLLSGDNKQIVVPNGTLSNTIITNVTAREKRRLEIKVRISYRTDIGKAKAVLEEILKKDPDAGQDADRVIFVDELTENAVMLGLRAWVPTGSYWTAKWRITENIKEAFDTQGILMEIPIAGACRWMQQPKMPE